MSGSLDWSWFYSVLALSISLSYFTPLSFCFLCSQLQLVIPYLSHKTVSARFKNEYSIYTKTLPEVPNKALFLTDGTHFEGA